MCSPCGPMVCYKYEDCGPPKGTSSAAAKRAEDVGEEKKRQNDQSHVLKRVKSRELRGGIMYLACHCIKRNGLQHDCRRTGCGGEPACVTLPDPICAPSQLARARGLAHPAPLQGHINLGGGSGSGSQGKRFIVCEVQGIITGGGGGKSSHPEDKDKKCCCNRPCMKIETMNVSTDMPVAVKLC